MNNEKLIELVREYGYLYDSNDKRYSDNERKELTWREIGKKLNQPDKVCKKQWNNLRDAFRRYIKKRKESTPEILASLKKWKHEEEMAFLLPFFKKRRPFPPLSVPVSDDELDDIPDEIPEVTCKTEKPNAAPEECEESQLPPGKKRPQEKPYPILIDHSVQERKLSALRTIPPDEIDMFFSSIASTVKRFSPYNRAIAKARVFAVVSELEIKDLIQNQALQSPQVSPIGPDQFTGKAEGENENSSSSTSTY